MPFINVKVAGTLNDEQKREIASRFARTLQEVAGKSPSSTYTVFDEVDRGNWAVGESLLSDR
jgi:4-oxalocrotonate tautomerase